MKKLKTFFFFLIIIYSCNSNNNNKPVDCIDSRYRAMFNDAINNQSTSSDFIVFTAINKKTNLSKEICCPGDFLQVCLKNNKECKIDTCQNKILVTDSVFNILGVDNYNYTLVDSLLSTTSDKLIDSIYLEHLNKNYSKLLELYTLKYQPFYFEHVLFKHKILTHIDCESGYIVISRKY